jgi:hypothetical protein
MQLAGRAAEGATTGLKKPVLITHVPLSCAAGDGSGEREWIERNTCFPNKGLDLHHDPGESRGFICISY